MAKFTPKVEDSVITHKKCVFADEEFIKRAKIIAKRLGINKDKPASIIVVQSDIIYLVGKTARTESDGDIMKIEKLAEDFAIFGQDVLDYMNESYKSPIYEYTQPRVEVEYSSYTGLIIKVPSDATKQDIIDQLDEVKRLQKLYLKSKDIKHKPPHNYELVYAIFKARKKHTFPEIYMMYADGKLPHYTGSIAKYMDEDKLELYYDKNKPRNT